MWLEAIHQQLVNLNACFNHTTEYFRKYFEENI